MVQAKPYPYPKPGAVGGKLIREVVTTLRGAQILPITSHILIAVSGGADSMALAKLLVRYGRRVREPSRIRLLHINHGWRGIESDADEAFVRAAAKRWGIPISVFRLKKISRKGRSPEEAAREQRKRIFEKMSRKYGSPRAPAWILTAHHADDLAETMIWRIFSGTSDSHGGGISVRHGQELRPFLKIRKKELVAFLREEGESWREDRTNFEGVLLRSKLRLEILPAIERLFPRAVEHLTRMAFEAQKRTLRSRQEDPSFDPTVLFSASGVAARRAHWEWVRKSGRPNGQLDLPGGWTLSKSSNSRGERWILERSAAQQPTQRISSGHLR